MLPVTKESLLEIEPANSQLAGTWRGESLDVELTTDEVFDRLSPTGYENSDDEVYDFLLYSRLNPFTPHVLTTIREADSEAGSTRHGLRRQYVGSSLKLYLFLALFLFFI